MSVADLPAPVLGSLSPSRASDFKTCPLLYRFRTIDRLPEQVTTAQARGTLVHAVLERLFDLPAPSRDLAAAEALIEPAWQALTAADEGVATLFAEPEQDGFALWLESVRGMLAGYFALEDPRRLEPAQRERLVEVALPDGLLLRGFVDRLDVAPNGDMRVVDYKTGAAPREAFEGKALFQLKFYALVIWRSTGAVPRRLRLLYLGDREVLEHDPDAGELTRFERTLEALWTAISRAMQRRDFRANPGRLCDWCDHRPLCPAHGGTPPPYPDVPPPPGAHATTSPAAED